MKRILTIGILFFVAGAFAQNDIEAGHTTFKARCAACHNIDKVIVGPALKDVDKRHDEKWIISFVHSSQTMIKNGDPAAVAVFNQMNQTVMPDHADLKDNDIRNIEAFIKDETKKLEAKAMEQPIKRPDEIKGTDRPLGKAEMWMVYLFGILGILLITALNMAINVNRVVKFYLRKKELKG